MLLLLICPKQHTSTSLARAVWWTLRPFPITMFAPAALVLLIAPIQIDMASLRQRLPFRFSEDNDDDNDRILDEQGTSVLCRTVVVSVPTHRRRARRADLRTQKGALECMGACVCDLAPGPPSVHDSVSSHCTCCRRVLDPHEQANRVRLQAG